MNIQEIREQGVGNGFDVLDPHDGYENNDRLWFGECATCGGRVTNSNLKGIWEHTVILETDGKGYTKSMVIDYCPSGGDNK